MSSKWVFPWENIESTDITLEQRRKLAKFIIDLGTKIPVKSNLCLYTAVAYMQRFYMLQSAKQFYPIRLCQAALFLACKAEKSPVTIQQICEKTSQVLNIPYNRASNAEKILQNEILDYEDALFSTLVFGFIVQHPYEHIKRVLANAQIASQVEHSIDSLKYIAYFLAKQSILLTTFSLQYSNELIAQFCVQFAIKIHDDTMISAIQLSESTDEYQQIEQLIREFSIIFIKHGDAYNKTFHDAKEYKLYTDIREIAEKYTKQLGDRSISRALNPTNVSQYPVLDNHPLLQMSASTALPSPSYTPTSPPQLTDNAVETGGLKRPYEYSNDEDNIPVKRFSTVLKSE